MKDHKIDLVKLPLVILIILISTGVTIFNHINRSQIKSIQASIKLKFQNRKEEDPAKRDECNLFDKIKSNIEILLQRESVTILQLLKRLKQSS